MFTNDRIVTIVIGTGARGDTLAFSVSIERFFSSSVAVNPTLTIIANALQVAKHLVDRIN